MIRFYLLLGLLFSSVILADVESVVSNMGYYYPITKISSDTVRIEIKNFSKEEIDQIIIKGLTFLLQDRLMDRAVLDDPEIIEALNKSKKYLKQYHYLEEKGTNYIEIQYKINKINDLLQKITHEIVLKRPFDLLFLLVIPDQLDEIVNEKNIKHNDFIVKIKESAYKKGINVIFPANDFPDQFNLQGNDILRLNLVKIKNASKPYRAKMLALGILNENLVGKLLIVHNERMDSLILQRDLDVLWNKILDNYSLGHEVSVDNELIKLDLTVCGVDTLERYKSLQEYLPKLSPLIKRVVLSRMDDRYLTFTLEVIGGEKTLQIILEGQNKLKVVDVENSVYRYETTNF